LETSPNPQLYVVPTPIGNLGDITLRALDVLKAADIILAEDTRTSSVLLKHYQIQKPLRPFHAFNEHRAVADVIALIGSGKTVALVCDAGTPGISDPGFLLVREAIKNQVVVECLPGPTAFVPALVQSGFPSDRFVFEGFLPHKKGRQTRLKALAEEERTVILYESPHRLLKLLAQLADVAGANRRIAVSRELTKKFAETVTGTVAGVLDHFTQKEVKGEIVVVLHGKES
jgi:16S rRNA (cytidine1402-2'-O)-methyltransferase